MQTTGRITLTGLLTASGTLICAASLIGFGGRLWWIFELASHFRLQYALALGLCLPPLLYGRRYRWATVFGMFALLNALLLAPRLLPRAEAVAHQGTGRPTFRVLLANVNSANRDYPQIRRSIVEHDPDFIVLLEVTPWLLERLAEFAGRYPYRVSAPREDPFGIALLGRQPLSRAEVVQFGAAGLPSIAAEVAAGGDRFILLGTHPPPPVSAVSAQDRNEQLTALALFARHAPHPTLLLGDLNVSPWSPYFTRLLADSGLRDSADGRGILPSWPVGLAPLWIPIDHALFSDGIRILRRETGSPLGSDHYPVVVDFHLTRS
ncbi:MAG: endonuclease/exonuclease/phosphatase family protein [Candidatus Competibacter sp.]|nr:endonuclease/exonuclease/phosphatase family protein [Candidatus Competibacter sp.]MDG4584152.1 endonuclease/exonuclease/phosphatase family protein [Candidatus Competibacter sp.]